MDRSIAIKSALEIMCEDKAELNLETLRQYCAGLENFAEPTPHEFAEALSALSSPMSHGEAIEYGFKLDNAMHEANIVVRDLLHEQRLARQRLAEAINRWQRQGGPANHSELAQQFCQQQLEERRARAAQGIPPTAYEARAGRRSYWDRVREAQKGGDANDFARKQMTTGNHRGAGFKQGQRMTPEQAAMVRHRFGLPTQSGPLAGGRPVTQKLPPILKGR